MPSWTTSTIWKRCCRHENRARSSATPKKRASPARLHIEGRGRYEISTGIRFLDHMLELFTKHGGFDLKLNADGDLDVDQHHTVEDVGIVLGQLFSQALGDRKGINRAGYFVLPMDETLAVVAVDLGGRPALVYKDRVKVVRVGDLQDRTGGRFLRRLREPRRRQPAREGALRPLEPSQDRGHFQMLRARHEIRLLEGRAAEGSVAVHQGAAMIAIFDYGAGNLRSVQNTLDEIGASTRWCAMPAGLAQARRKILLPGVGHFGQMMRALDELEVRDTLIDRIAAGVPFLGICLGLQALFEASEEAPEVRGLGIFRGIVRVFRRMRACRTWAGTSSNCAAPRDCCAALRRIPLRLFRPQLLCAGRRIRQRALHLRRAVHGGARSRQRLRRAVPSGEIGRGSASGDREEVSSAEC